MFTYWIHLVISLSAIINPVGNVPVFLALTAGRNEGSQRQIARRAVWVAFSIAAVFAVLGRWILLLFGITLSAFRVAGGFILFTIALRLLEARPSHMHQPLEEEQPDGTGEDDVAITPLGTPLLAGPGTITTAMALGNYHGFFIGTGLVLLALATVLVGTFWVFRSAPWFGKRLGPTGFNIVTRMMGLLLAVVAVQMAADGLAALLPGLRLR